MMDDVEDDFFEEDEPVEKIEAAFARGPHGVTAPPVPVAGAQMAEASNFRLISPPISTIRDDDVRKGHLVQA